MNDNPSTDCGADSAAFDAAETVEVWLRLGNGPSRRVGTVRRDTLQSNPLVVADLLALLARLIRHATPTTLRALLGDEGDNTDADADAETEVGVLRFSGARFYLVYECPACGEDIHHGPCLTLLRHRDLPAIPADLGATLSTTCPHCHTDVHVGELELFAAEEL